MSDAPTYGQIRTRHPEVTYAQIERAATDILKAGVRPTLNGVRKAIGGGSPRTILDGLNRFWRALGGQVAGNPDTLRRLPASVADLAEGLWQKALTVATEAAQGNTSEGQAQLMRLKSQLELRSHTLSQREVELDSLLRSRERTVKELEEHLRVALSMLAKRDKTIESLGTQLASAREETEEHRQRLSRVIQRAIAKHQDAAKSTAPKRPKRATAGARRTSKLTQRKPALNRSSGRKVRRGK